MADRREKKTGSPTEYFDPLQEVMFDLDYTDESEDVLLNSMDGDADSQPVYGTTPPLSHRHAKRAKERARSLKKLSRADYKMVQERHRIEKLQAARRSGVGIHAGESVTSDEDATVPWRKPKRSSRKLSSSAFETSPRESEESGGFTEQTPLSQHSSLAVSSSFSSLNVRPLPSPLSSGSLPDESVPVTSQNKERTDFAEEFALLMNALLAAGAEKDRGVMYQRSREQAQYQAQTHELIWLYLKAWQHGNKLEEEDKALSTERQKINQLLNELMVFRAEVTTPPRRRRLSTQLSITEVVEPMPVIPESGISYIPGLLNDRPTQGCEVELLTSVRRQQEALHLVQLELDKLEHVEALYPTLKALGDNHSLYSTRVFQQRLEALHLWVNVTREVALTLQMMARILHVDTAHTRWPWVTEWEDCVVPSTPVTPAPSAMPSTPVFTEAKKPEQRSVQFSTPGDYGVGDTSTPLKSTPRSTSMNSSMSRTSSSYSVDEYTKTSLYRYFVDRSLKKYGCQKMMRYVNRCLEMTLCRTRAALICAEPGTPQSAGSAGFSDEARSAERPPSLLSAQSERVPMSHCSDILAALEPDLVSFAELGLPSLAPCYMFLVRIPLDLIHECLRLRLEQRPDEPSYLSVHQVQFDLMALQLDAGLLQLISEYKELLRVALKTRDWYAHMLAVVTDQPDEHLDLDEFEDSFKSMFEGYLEYLQHWSLGQQKSEAMNERFKDQLENEWAFAKEICYDVRGGEAYAASSFCSMTCGLLQSTSGFLDGGIDECVSILGDTTVGGQSDVDYEVINIVNENEDVVEYDRVAKSTNIKHGVGQTCRKFRDLFFEARKRVSKALGFAKLLVKDLEIAAEFTINTKLHDLYAKLKETNHEKVLTASETDYEIFVPSSVAKDPHHVIQLLHATRGDPNESLGHFRHPGYIILVRCGDSAGESCPLWNGKSVDLKSTADTSIALSHAKVQSVLLIVTNSANLHSQLREFSGHMGGMLKRSGGQTSSHQAISDALGELKTAAVDLRERIDYSVEQVEQKLCLDDVTELEQSHQESIASQYKEILIQCYNFGIEYYMEVLRLVHGEQRDAVYRHMVDFAHKWMLFVTTKCEKGKGSKPRWASPGFNFLLQVCDLHVLNLLTPQQYAELKKDLNACIVHIIGQKDSATPAVAEPHHLGRFVSWPENRPSVTNRSVSNRSVQSEPRTPFRLAKFVTENGSGEPSFERVEGDLSYETRFQAISVDEPDAGVPPAVQELENRLDEQLRTKRVIGRVTDKRAVETYSLPMRRPNFKWQRGIKIGEGQFGKVYAAVNSDSGELMAMKEIQFQPNDLQAIKQICDEIRIFESINHPNLVKYYGSEVHRGEMLIFMEYCGEGTLADAAKLGLTEQQVRRYTLQLLHAINAMHERHIAHRDIKGPNVFLTNHSHMVKLGDFGCAVKLRTNQTQPGEVTKAEGTAAYMAPEVIAPSSKTIGAGRASDIWSLACVVVEMVTGKRPWHEYESNFQIMYKVGLGHVPTTPENLSAEGKAFLAACFQNDPQNRPSALDLLADMFVKVGDVDEEE